MSPGETDKHGWTWRKTPHLRLDHLKLAWKVNSQHCHDTVVSALAKGYIGSRSQPVSVFCASYTSCLGTEQATRYSIAY